MKKLTLLAAALLVTACGDKGTNTAATAENQELPKVAAPADGDWSKSVIQTPAGGMLIGNPEAKVKVVEFGSMTCHVCAEFAKEGEQALIQNYVKPGNVSFEFRNFVRDPLDITMSLVTRCAGASPQFFQLTEAMFADQKAFFDKFQAVPPAELQGLQSLAPAQQFARISQFAGLQEWAAQRGLPSAKTSQCLANQAEIEKLVGMNSEAVAQYNISGTPSFTLNGELLEAGQQQMTHWQFLESRIKAALGS